MEVSLTPQQVNILRTILALGPQRVNRALSAAEITEVLRLDSHDDIQFSGSIHADIQSLAAMGFVEHYLTLHEWRLTAAGEAFCAAEDGGEQSPKY